MSKLSAAVTLKDTIRLMVESLLFEVGEEGAGVEFEKAEAEARRKYEDAKAALKAWDDNAAKKKAFDAALASLRKTGVGEERARKQLKADPKYAYDVVLASKKRETLEGEVDKAEARYGAFNPEVRGYRRDRKGGAKTSADKQLPPKGKKAFLDITKIPFMTWHKWPAAVKRTKLSYGSKAAGEETEQASSGTGPGEEWLAYIFGGQVQGGGVSYDVVMPDGSSWEVKQLLRASETIRPGTEGLKAFEHARERLVRIMKQLQDFVKAADEAGLESKLTGDTRKKLQFVKSFVEDEFEMIVGKGEVSKERFIDLRSVLMTVNRFKQAVPADKSRAPKQTTVALNDKKVPVDKPTFIDVAQTVKKATHREDILSDVAELDIVVSALRDSAFDDPTTFFNEWFQSVKLENVFSQVDGVIIVNPNGFMIVPMDQLQSAMKFEKVTQGKPRFVFTLFGSGPSAGGKK